MHKRANPLTILDARINGRDDVPWFWFPVAVCLHLIAHATLGANEK